MEIEALSYCPHREGFHPKSIGSELKLLQVNTVMDKHDNWQPKVLKIHPV